ncbi:hypothetical protein E4T56_gene17459 [Termitomyces sp. T112]|nr:hypothetical protein E4T56_gene17459 [Termitomyces sp. T112]
MCGVPVHAAESYLARLIKAGCRVAIAEQVETPEQAKKRGGYKALVMRDIVRFVTAGTLTEEALLEPRRANVLAAACPLRDKVGVAAVDISTGRMELEECEPENMGAALARLGASEIIAPDNWGEAPFESIPRGAHEFSSEGGADRLCGIHGVATLDGFGTFTRPMLAAACGLLAYLDHVGRGKLPLLLPPVARHGEAHMTMDEATRGSLEILRSSSGNRAGSLIEAVDRQRLACKAKAQIGKEIFQSHAALARTVEGQAGGLVDDQRFAVFKQDGNFRLIRRERDAETGKAAMLAAKGAGRDDGHAMFEQMHGQRLIIAKAGHQGRCIDHAIEGAIGDRRGQVGNRIDRIDAKVAPRAELLAPVEQEFLRSLERGHGARLRKRAGIARDMALEPSHGRDQPGRTCRHADAQAGHRMAFRHA